MVERVKSTSQKVGLVRVLTKHKWGVVATSLALTVVVFIAEWLFAPAETLATYIGLFATTWALVLAVFIYFVASVDTEELLDDRQALIAQVSSLARGAVVSVKGDEGSIPRASEEQYDDYVQALLQEYPAIPRDDLVSVDRPGEGKGNRPVIIETQRGRRYSIWRGAPGGRYYVNRLANVTEE